MDGAAKGCPGLVGARGLIRDNSHWWIDGFAKNIGVAPTLVAELWEALLKLELVWDLGYHKVFLEIDSEVVCRIAQS